MTEIIPMTLELIIKNQSQTFDCISVNIDLFSTRGASKLKENHIVVASKNNSNRLCLLYSHNRKGSSKGQQNFKPKKKIVLMQFKLIPGQEN